MAWKPASGRAQRYKRIPLFTAAAMLSIGAGIASANGGVSAPPPPKLSDVTCVDRCAGVRKATVGSKVEFVGRDLDHVSIVRFPGGDGWVKTDPDYVGARRVLATVPQGAATGKPRVRDPYGQVSASPNELKIVSEDQLPSPGTFQIQEVKVRPAKAFYAARRKPKLVYVFAGDGPTDVRIDVVKRGSGKVVRSFIKRDQQPFTTNRVKWNGLKSNGRVAPNGGYKFRLGANGGPLSDGGGKTNFRFYGHKFPVRGPHQYWDGVGADRGDHKHQGQDIGAACGTRLVAARGGRVKWKAYQGGGAGYYLVIDGRRTGKDYVYMHLKGPATVKKGERVKTGQSIGKVGSTGSSTACHLHFELWSRPGWYSGGTFLRSVTRKLKRWDSWS